MRESLQNWINDADNVRMRSFLAPQIPIDLAHVMNRPQDFYISLVGELFNCLRTPSTSGSDWAQLGNAFLQFAVEMSDMQLAQYGISREESILLSAASFYFGNYPASAYLAMKRASRPPSNEISLAGCYDFLVKPTELGSIIAHAVREALVSGNQTQMERLLHNSRDAVQKALHEGPIPWIHAVLMNKLLESFHLSSLRSVLPDGNDAFWTPLVESLIYRQPPTWEFFPSQIEAINGGLLSSNDTYTLQMPTGAGKTTLCETLLYSHLNRYPDHVAIMLVPYRSLASELRATLVRRLNALGIASRSAYGGTVPVGEELHELANVRAIIATPEALSGLLGASPELAERIGLIIVDEGHLLDSSGRGIGLELLLARMKGRTDQSIRFVFISAIVPNVEEINSWLGGTDETVIRSTYRPALAEFAVLQPEGRGSRASINLKVHPHEQTGRQFLITGFLDRNSFTYVSPQTGRQKTYDFNSIKTQSIAVARKALPMGPAAIFAANKRGMQGAIGIAESLVKQLQINLPIPKPIDFVQHEQLQRSIAYFDQEYGTDWIGTQSIQNGFALHHGDIPQEAREIIEVLIRNQDVKLVICTNTLAEGVNLPIRTLVLYSVQRRREDGSINNMLMRDIKNLVGRAGRAGANTKGLVICANASQWELIQPVAMQGAGEPVRGSLRTLVEQMTTHITQHNIVLNNEFLELSPAINPLIDGVDSTLIELLSDEIGEDAFVELATQLAEHTFAASQLPEASANNLRLVFSLRAMKIMDLKHAGKILWARETGAKVRLIDSVEQTLLPLRADWSADVDPLSNEILTQIFQWAWTHKELRLKVKECFRLDDSEDIESHKDHFFEITRLWMSGAQFRVMAEHARMPMDDLLAVYTNCIAFSLQTLIEQGISLLSKCLEAEGIEIARGIRHFPEHLRFGVPNAAARILASKGVRHRNACVQLGIALTQNGFPENDNEIKLAAARSLRSFREEWRATLGDLVYQNTLLDLPHNS